MIITLLLAIPIYLAIKNIRIVLGLVAIVWFLSTPMGGAIVKSFDEKKSFDTRFGQWGQPSPEAAEMWKWKKRTGHLPRAPLMRWDQSKII